LVAETKFSEAVESIEQFPAVKKSSSAREKLDSDYLMDKRAAFR
jgi:hypothetical protein